MNFRRKTLGGIATTTTVGPADGASATYAITGQACNLWTGVLTDALVPQINQYLTHLFDLAVEEGKQLGRADKKSIYGIFQRNCIAVKDIAVTELDNRIQVLEAKVKNLQRVIITVLKLTFSVMSVSRTNNLSQVKIKPIDRRDFVKQCYQSSAYEVGVRYPHWFDKGLEFAKRQEYFYQAQVAIGAAITHVILENIPHELISAKPQQNPDEVVNLNPSPRKTVRHKAPSLLVPTVAQQSRARKGIKNNEKQGENSRKTNRAVSIRKQRQASSPRQENNVKSKVPSNNDDDDPSEEHQASNADVPPDRLLPTKSPTEIGSSSHRNHSGGSKTVTPNSKHASVSPFANNSRRDKTLANPQNDGFTNRKSDHNASTENNVGSGAQSAVVVGNSVRDKQTPRQSKRDEFKQPSSSNTGVQTKTLSATKTNMTPVAISVAPTSGDTGHNKNTEPPQILLMPNTLANAKSNNNGLANGNVENGSTRANNTAVRVGTPVTAGKVGTPRTVATTGGPTSQAQSSIGASSIDSRNESSPLDSKSSALETDMQRSLKHVQNMMKNNPENDEDFDEDFEIEVTPADLEHHVEQQEEGKEDDEEEEKNEKTNEE